MRPELERSYSGKKTVSDEEIKQVLSMLTGIPLTKVSAQESQQLLQLENTLKRSLIGQDEAVAAVSRAISRPRVGIRDETKPIGCFLFTGLTGVGKTEMAKLLAENYLGSKKPWLVLLDEIEKANDKVFNVLLQILDDGRLTDGKGRTVDFRNAIIILTSNIGSSLSKINEVASELKGHFKPELLNRLDQVVVFKALEKGNVKEILEIMVDDFCERVGTKKKKMKVEVSERLKEKLAAEGYSKVYGARPLKREITRLLEDNLADKILSGSVHAETQPVLMDVDHDGEVIFSRIL